MSTKQTIKNIKSNAPRIIAVGGSNGLAFVLLAQRYREDALGLTMSAILVFVSVVVSLKKG